MENTLQEMLEFYRAQGAPSDQNALIGLLRELQQDNGGGIPRHFLPQIAQFYNIRESFLQAIIRRIPSLRLSDCHCLELCAGPNCGKHTALAACAQRLFEGKKGVTLKFGPCMRMCGKGPNIKWDGKIHHQASEALLRQLLDEVGN